MLDHAITVRDVLYASGGMIALVVASALGVAAYAMWDEWIDLITHRYIRTGEIVHLYQGYEPKHRSSRVTVGWGKYAAVRVDDNPVEVIRRDCIHMDADGKWVYRYDD